MKKINFLFYRYRFLLLYIIFGFISLVVELIISKFLVFYNLNYLISNDIENSDDEKLLIELERIDNILIPFGLSLIKLLVTSRALCRMGNRIPSAQLAQHPLLVAVYLGRYQKFILLFSRASVKSGSTCTMYFMNSSFMSRNV